MILTVISSNMKVNRNVEAGKKISEIMRSVELYTAVTWMSFWQQIWLIQSSYKIWKYVNASVQKKCKCSEVLFHWLQFTGTANLLTTGTSCLLRKVFFFQNENHMYDSYHDLIQKMSLEHLMLHYLQGRVLLLVQVSMSPEILIR